MVLASHSFPVPASPTSKSGDCAWAARHCGEIRGGKEAVRDGVPRSGAQRKLQAGRLRHGVEAPDGGRAVQTDVKGVIIVGQGELGGLAANEDRRTDGAERQARGVDAVDVILVLERRATGERHAEVR